MYRYLRFAGFRKDAKKNAPRCLLFVLISIPLNGPRRQGIWISSSSQMGCQQDNSLFLTWHSTCNKPWLIPGYIHLYTIISILLTMSVSSTTRERSSSAMRHMESYLRSTMGVEGLFNLSLMHMYTQTCASRFGYDNWWLLLAEKIGALIFHSLVQLKNNE
jgi:hypothetical protein